MRAEKQNLSSEYLSRLNASPFFIVVDYRGLKVGPITELRKRLGQAGAEMHVVKNSLFRRAAREAGVADLGAALADLPSIEVLRGRLLGVLAGPATKLVVLLNTPATQLARVLKARTEKQEAPAAAAA